MQIVITNYMHLLATDIELTIEHYRKQGVVKYGDYALDEKNRFYTGALGELAFVQALTQAGKKAHFKPSILRADDGDVELYSIKTGQGAMVDVKTASKSNYRFMMIPNQQLAHPKSAYIGVKLNLRAGLATVHGFCVHKDLKPISNGICKVPTSGLSLCELTPVERLFEQCEDGEVTTDFTNVKRVNYENGILL